MFTSSSTETFDIVRERRRARARKESMRSTVSRRDTKGKGREREYSPERRMGQVIPLDLLSSYPHSDHLPLTDLPSVVVAETFSTPLLPNGGRDWSYVGRLAIRLFADEEALRPRIHARQLGRRGRTVFDAFLTHPVVYSDQPVGCSLWLKEPEEEVRGWCFRFDDPLTARQFATLASVLTEDDPIIRKNVRRIERGDWGYCEDDVLGESAEGSGRTEGSWISRRMSWLSTRS